MTVSTIVWSPTVQRGASVGAAWVDLAGPITLTLSSNNNAGIIFDANNDQTLRFATVGGQSRILDGPNVLTTSLKFVATRTPANVLPLIVEVGIVPDAQPADFSNTALPWERGEVSLGVFDLGAVSLNPATLTITLTLDGVLSKAHCTSRAAWNGRYAISLRMHSTTVGNAVILSLNSEAFELVTTQESVFFSGMAGGPYGGHVRSVRDGRYAMPATNLELVRDGDQPGLFVRPWDQDPEDEQATYRRRPGEGTVDDQVPDL